MIRSSEASESVVRENAGSKLPAFLRISFFVLLAAAAYVRFADLATHMTHVDDIGVAKTILAYKQINYFDSGRIDRDLQSAPYGVHGPGFDFLKGVRSVGLLYPALDVWKQAMRMTYIPRQWTYAPLQFFGTYYLLHEGQSYREKIFWGRFPSFVMGVLGILALAFFYRRYGEQENASFLFGVSLMSFSWENIIYAKQMESYAIGVTFSALLLALLVSHARHSTLTFKRILLDVSILALAGWGQYQNLFIAPAYFFAVGIHYWMRGQDKTKLVGSLMAGFLFYGMLVYPLYHFFLRVRSQAGIAGSNVGPAGEFRFLFTAGMDFPDKILYALKFFLGNFPIIVSSNLSFVPEQSVLFIPVNAFLMILMLAGAAAFARSSDPHDRALTVFFSSVTVIWILLVASSKMTFGPTRHSLILLPFMVVCVVKGWETICRGIPAGFFSRSRWPSVGAAFLIPVIFFCFWASEVKARRDPFDESQIQGLLQEWNIDTIVSVGWTWNFSLMRGIWDTRNYFEDGFMKHAFDNPTDNHFRRVAFVSHRTKLGPVPFSRMRGEVNAFLKRFGVRGWDYSFEDYRVIYQKELESDVEIEMSRRTKSGSNNFFFYVLERLPEAVPHT